MTADVVVCPRCETNLQNSVSVAGQIVACPQCQTQLRMPPLSTAEAGLPLPTPDALPPEIELPPPTPGGSATHLPGAGPVVQTARPGTRVTDRLRRRSNPWMVLFTITAIVLLIGVAAALFLWDRTQKERKRFSKQLIGNWELVPGQEQLQRWDFAFHPDGKLQMALENQLNEGRWRVVSCEGGIGHVLISWPDDAPETMRVTFDGGTMQVELDSVGSFTFRTAGLP